MAVSSPAAQLGSLVRTLADGDWRVAPGIAPDAVAGQLPALRAHGLLAGVARRLEDTTLWPRLDEATRRSLQDAARSASARELASARPLEAALAALAAARIPVLVVKGEALAAQAYALPGLRERGDVDAWVAVDDFTRAEHVLAALGFAKRPAASGEWLQPEATWTRDEPGALLALDLHRRLFAQPALAAVLPFAEAWAASQPFTASARMPSPAHALLVAALHRVAHHADDDRLVWTWDVHQLCTRFPDAVAEAARIARERGASALLGDALERSVRAFGTPLAADFVDELVAQSPRERSARLLRPMSATGRWWYDLRTLPDASARRRWIAETLFPSRDWMRAKFGDGPLAWHYAKRAVRGAWRAITKR
ncbi:MAG TPA: nucleotidyltransferase family protein [Xanthomonadales bacterium]|nr:nucleotidyltransferase family protein [Xanthomonadales bacterium]